ncbi:unnamed protein product, partial [Acanthocheilonema viteae]
MSAPVEQLNIFDVWNYLEREPVMLHALQRYMNERMREAERRLEELEERNAQEEMDEESIPQEAGFSEDGAEWAPLPDYEDQEYWPSGAEWSPLPDDESEEPEVSATPMVASGNEGPEEAVRELVLRSRTITIPVLAMQGTSAAAAPEEFCPADLGDLPEQFRKELQVPRAEPYTVARGEGNNSIVCGICDRQFETIKGWRIHASRMHKQDGFCVRCGHYLLLPPDFTAAQKTAALELHGLDWCPRSSAAVINERQVKRRRLQLVGREEDSQHLFIP